MFYSTSPDPGTAWQVVLTLGVLIGLAVGVVSLVRQGKPQSREVTPQPLMVELRKDFPTRPEFDRLDSDVREIRSDFKSLGLKLDAINRENESRASRLHQRIDEIPGDIIATLRNAGGLKQ